MKNAANKEIKMPEAKIVGKLVNICSNSALEKQSA
jgi:hypothetical protein